MRLRKAALALFLAAVALGCGASNPEHPDWLVLRLPAEMPHLNPITSTDAYSALLLDQIFDGLLDRDPQTLEMRPHVAESWDISDDHLVYTFHLRKDVLFSDGTPLTAHDVKFTFDKMMDPKTDAPHLRNYYQDVTSCEVLDDHTVRYTCCKPYYLHLVMLGSLYIIPRHIYGEGDFNNHPSNSRPVGSGMYVLERWDVGQQVTLARNERYWGGAVGKTAHFAKKIYRVITDDNVAFQVLAAGDLDVMNVRAEDWERRAKTPSFDERFNKYTFYLPNFNYIGWNSRKPYFSEPLVRRALTMMVDRERIRETVFYGHARTVSGVFMTGTPENNEAIQPWPFDPAAATQLLDQAGWADTDRDGVRDKGGVPFQFEILITNANPVAEQICTIAQDEFRRAGVVMTIRPMEWASLLERVDSRNFDAILMGWAMTPDPDPYQIWHSSQIEKGSNYVGFNNPEGDRLIEEARISFDRARRIELYHRFHEMLHELQPYTFMFSPESLLAVDKRVGGVTIYPFGPDQREWRLIQQ